MYLLDNVIQEYAWGSRTAIAELLGTQSPSPRPQAELWMGAHPSAPSRTQAGTLLELVEADPRAVLGEAVHRRHGGRLPFLLKVLAAGAPLSLQAHPSLAQAQEGFARENQAGVAADAPHRNYKDANHKPEILCALGPFDALCGFRAALESAELLERLEVEALAPVVESLRASAGIRGAFEHLMHLPRERQERVASEVARAARELPEAAPFAAERAWCVRLAQAYPGDIGAVVSLLLNLVRLKTGEAIYLPAGNLHAYLSGTGVELMASSDNVLRGGLTPKHVDVPELMRVLDFAPIAAEPLRAEQHPGGEQVYVTAAPDFRLSRWALAGSQVQPERRGPELLLCTEGRARLQAGSDVLELPRGAAAFIPASTDAYALEGSGVVYRATVGAQEAP